MTPVFIFSLPRSGSTLLQRSLAAYDAIETVSEPWFLLPMFYLLKRNGVYAEYGHGSAVMATEDLCGCFPNGVQDYISEVRSFALNIYQRAMKDDAAKYFIDKTPRYHLIANEIINAFPEGKFIFLWRNPLAIMASMIGMSSHNKWNLHDFKIDLYEGAEGLLAAHELHKDKSISVCYEKFILQPGEEIHRILNYLGYDSDERIPDKIKDVNLVGRFGDPAGSIEYESVSSAPISKWKSILNNPVRKWYALRYLNWLGPDMLKLMGYDYDVLAAELRNNPVSAKNSISDILRIIYGAFYCGLEPYIFRQKIRKLPSWNRIYPHV